jgi:hypothetical protein
LSNILKDPVVKQKKQAIYVTHSRSYHAHTESLFKSTTILPFPVLANFFKFQYTAQHKYNYLPTSFRETWITNADRSENADASTLSSEDDYYVALH